MRGGWGAKILLELDWKVVVFVVGVVFNDSSFQSVELNTHVAMNEQRVVVSGGLRNWLDPQKNEETVRWNNIINLDKVTFIVAC